jgi:hypothetical protein
MDIEESVQASCILKDFKTVAVGAQVSGQLKTLHVALETRSKRGCIVRCGAFILCETSSRKFL